MDDTKLLDTDAAGTDPAMDGEHEKVNELRYIGVRVNKKNYWSREIGIRIVKGRPSRCRNFLNEKSCQRKQDLDSAIVTASYINTRIRSTDDCERNGTKTCYFRKRDMAGDIV